MAETVSGPEVEVSLGIGQRERVDVSHLPNGLYVLQLVQEKAKS